MIRRISRLNLITLILFFIRAYHSPTSTRYPEEVDDFSRKSFSILPILP